MPRKIIAGFAVVLMVLTFALPLHAQSTAAAEKAAEPANKAKPAKSLREKIAALEEKSRTAEDNGKWVSLYSSNMKLNQLVPYEPRYLINVVRACGQLGRGSTAYHFMHTLQQQGFTHDFNSTDDTLKIRDTEAYQYLNKMLMHAANPAGEGMLEFRLPGNPANYSALAWDESAGRFLAGTRREGALIAVSSLGETTELLTANKENGILSITGLAVDAENNRLWIASAATPEFAAYPVPDEEQGALFELNLETLELVGRHNVPEDGQQHQPGQVAVSDFNDVYMIDKASPIVYRKASEGDELEAFFTSPELLGLTDIAVTPDNTRLYISDAEMGIMAIDPIAGQSAMLTGPDTMNLSGVGGLAYHEGELFLTQGGFLPPRIIRLKIDGTGEAVESVGPMAVALSEFNRPELAAIWGDRLFFIANSGAEEDSDVIVMSSRLDAAFDVQSPTIEELQKAIKDNTQ